jgi:hypothetical protein
LAEQLFGPKAQQQALKAAPRGLDAMRSSLAKMGKGGLGRKGNEPED